MSEKIVQLNKEVIKGQIKERKKAGRHTRRKRVYQPAFGAI